MAFATMTGFREKKRGRVTINGIVFDSIAEADRCKILRVMEKTGSRRGFARYARSALILRLSGNRHKRPVCGTSGRVLKYFPEIL